MAAAATSGMVIAVVVPVPPPQIGYVIGKAVSSVTVNWPVRRLISKEYVPVVFLTTLKLFFWFASDSSVKY